MATYDVPLQALPRLFEELETQRIERMFSAIYAAAEAGVATVVRNAPKDQGLLRKSIHAVHSEHESAILADAPHAGIVEMGSRPHKPPLRPLIAWVMRHRRAFGLGRGRLTARPTFVTRRRGLGGFGAASLAGTDAEATRIAVMIQRKIMREGTQPTWFMRKSLPRLRQILARELRRAVRDLKR
jgi:hypothetical protein